MGKSRSKKRAAERRAQQRKQRNRNIAIGVGVVAVVAVILVILATRPVAVSIEDEVLVRYEGLPTSTTDRGFPILGNPEAPARLVEYSSFDCPSCRIFHDNITKNVISRVRNGEASFTYVPVFGTGGIPNGDDAASAAICAGEQGRFWEYHDLLFSWQEQYIAAAFQPRRLEAGAIELGLDVEQFNTCRNSSETAEVLDNARAAFAQSGSTGTPSLVINDNQVPAPTLAGVNAQIDAIMANADPVPVEIVEDDEADESEAEEPSAEAEVDESNIMDTLGELDASAEGDE